MFKDILIHPYMRGIDNDDPTALVIRRKVMKSKGFLESIYKEWYSIIKEAIPHGRGRILEIGSGGGIINDIIPKAFTSDVSEYAELDIVFNASHEWPMKQDVLKAIILVNTFHHLPDVKLCLNNSSEKLCMGGKILLIDPWYTAWSRYVFDKLHHEPFITETTEWSFQSTGPLSGANQALSWIVFKRDISVFSKNFQQLRVRRILQLMPLCYLLSGGFGTRITTPSFLYPLIRKIERLGNLEKMFSMFAFIEIEKIEE